ncbi:MAG: hypothetical protein ACFCVK_16490 [Acidimicrobiales bacterium]
MYQITDEADSFADGTSHRPVLGRWLDTTPNDSVRPSRTRHRSRLRSPRPGARSLIALVAIGAVVVAATAAVTRGAGPAEDGADMLAAGIGTDPPSGAGSPTAGDRPPAGESTRSEQGGVVSGERDIGPDGESERTDGGGTGGGGDGGGTSLHPATTVLAVGVGVPSDRPAPTPSPGSVATRPVAGSESTGLAATVAPVPTAPVLTTTRPAPTVATPTGGGRLVWADEFDRLDTTVWAVEHSTYGDGNDELQCYRPENVSVSGGRLVLRAVTETYTCPNGSTRRVTSGMVRSRGVTVSPGQSLEFRVKLSPADPGDQGGLWPAVWASGLDGGGWPRSGEIDFLEVMTANDPRRSIYSVHYAKPDGTHGVSNRPVVGPAPFSTDWHTVRFEYGRGGALRWYLDGGEVFAVSGISTAQGAPAPFDLPVREIKINLALGGRPGPLAPGAVGAAGATFEIDYVRIREL